MLCSSVPASRRCSSSSPNANSADRARRLRSPTPRPQRSPRDPVAEVRALERAAHDVRDRDLAGELAVLEDQEAVGGAGGAVALDGGQARALARARVEAGLAARIPGREVLALGGEERRELAGVRAHRRADRDRRAHAVSVPRLRPGRGIAGRVRSPRCLWPGAPRSSRSARRSPSSPSSCSSASSPAASASSPRPCTPASTPAAALLTLYAVGVADRPADHEHPYGHGKAQNLSALGEAAILVLAAAWIARLGRPAAHAATAGEVDATWYAAAMLGLVLVIDAARATTSRARRAQRGQRRARRQRRALRRRLRRHARGHGRPRLHGARASARRRDRRALRRLPRRASAPSGSRGSNVNALMDSAPAGAEANLRAVVASLPGVTEVRALRVRSSGGKYFADVVIGVDRLAGLERSHAVMDEVERVVEHELGGPAEVSVHAEPLAADERPSERVVAAALRVAGRDRGAQRDRADAAGRARDHAARARRRGPAAAGGGDDHAAPARRDPPRDGRRRRLHPPRAARARRDGRLRRHRPPARPPRARRRRGAAGRRRARGGARVRARRPLRRRAAGARGAGPVGRRRARARRARSRRRCARRSASSRRSWSRSTRERSSARPPPSCSRAPTSGSSARAPTASCARAGRGRPMRCSCSARRSGVGRAAGRRCGARPAAARSPATTTT